MSDIRIGCEAFIVRDDKLLLGMRGESTYGSGTWALPGGHLEPGERLDECIVREIKEEMDIEVPLSAVSLIAITDDIQTDTDRQYVHVTFIVDIGDASPKIAEPDYCQEWRWFAAKDLPSTIFPPHRKIFATIDAKTIYASK